MKKEQLKVLPSPDVKPVYYVDAIPSSGKSVKLLEHIKSYHGDNRILVALPTANLLKQMRDSLKGISSRTVLSSEGSTSVVQALKAALADDCQDRVILCTHDALSLYAQSAVFDGAMRKAFQNVQVFIDEVPAGSFGQQIRVRHSDDAELENNFHFMRWLSVDSKGGFFLNSEHFDELKKYWEEKHAHSEEAKDIVWCLLNNSVMTKTTDEAGFWLTCYCANPILLASQWSVSFTVMGCGASDSELLYRAKEHLNYSVIAAADKFQPDISRQRFSNTKNITIDYVLEEKATMTNLSSVYLEALQWAKKNYRNEFLYSSNNDKSTQSLNIKFTSLADDNFIAIGERISMSAFGLNYFAGYDVCNYSREELASYGVQNVDAAYKGYRKCVYLASVNMDPFSLIRIKKYCDVMNWDFDAINLKWHTQQNAERCLQVLSRTVIRNRANQEKVSFLVLDKQTAEYLKEKYFYDCEIKHTGIKLPKKVRKQKEKTKGNMQYQKVKSLKAEGKKNREIAILMSLSLKQVGKYSAMIKKETLDMPK